MTGQQEKWITDEPIPRYSVDKRVRKGRYTVLRDGEFFAEVAVHVDAVRIAMAMEMAHKQVRSRPVHEQQASLKDSGFNEQEPGELEYGSILPNGEDWRLRRCDAGMGETEYRIFRNEVFFAQFDNRKDADTVMEVMTHGQEREQQFPKPTDEQCRICEQAIRKDATGKVLEQLDELRRYANGEYKEADCSDNEREMRIHLEYENRVWGIMRELRGGGQE